MNATKNMFFDSSSQMTITKIIFMNLFYEHLLATSMVKVWLDWGRHAAYLGFRKGFPG